MKRNHYDFGVPAGLTRQVSAAQLQLRGAYRDSLRVGVRLGALLAKAKEICRHGEFEDWLDGHFEASARHARRLMQLARTYPDPKSIPALSLSEALRLLTAGEPEEKTVRANERLSGEPAWQCCRSSRGTETDRGAHDFAP